MDYINKKMGGLERAKARSLYVLPYFFTFALAYGNIYLIKMKQRGVRFLTKKKKEKMVF